MLNTENISYYYQDGETRRIIFKDINLNIEKGKFYAILGKSGSGKTTLLSLLSALDKPKEGHVKFDNQDIEEIGETNYRRNKVGIVFQQYNLIPHLTAYENVMVAVGITNNKLPNDIQLVVYNLLNYLGLNKDKANRLVTQLSGGEQQRVAIARSLATNVDLIIADEPTGNLDEQTETEIINIFKTLAHEHQKCVIVVTHSQDIADEADVVLHLENGIISIIEEHNE